MESEETAQSISKTKFHTIESIEELVKTGEKHPLLVEKKKDDCQNIDNSLKIKLVHLKGQYSQQKHSLQEEKTKLLFLQCVESGKFPEDGETVDDYKAACKEVQRKKGDLAEVQMSLDEETNALEEIYNQYTNNLTALNHKIQLYQSKEQEQERHLENGNRTEATSTEIQELEKQLAEAEAKNRAVEEQLERETVEVASLRVERENVQATLHRDRVNVDRLQTQIQIITEDNPNQEKNVQKCKETLTLLERMTDLKVKGYTENSVTLEILSHASKNADSQPLELTMFFTLGLEGTHILTKAKVNVDSLDVRDLIATAVQNDDIQLLVSGIQTAWQKHRPVHTEIENLRSRYALDWLHKEGLVKVLCGSNASILCTLKVDPGYPHAGRVTLTDAVGLPSDLSLHDLKPEAEDATLGSWLESLHEKLGGANTTMDITATGY